MKRVVTFTAAIILMANMSAQTNKIMKPQASVTNINTVTDGDGNEYHSITIGTQVWLNTNLKTTKYNDYTDIPLVTDNSAWENLATPGYCWYNNDQAKYGEVYGALYNWYAANSSTNGGKNVCPTDWHVPTEADWNTLIEFLGGTRVAGGKLKETDTTHWDSPNIMATNETLFNALPGGYRYYNGKYYNVGHSGYWWCDQEFGDNTARSWSLNYSYPIIDDNESYKQNGSSIRCIKDY